MSGNLYKIRVEWHDGEINILPFGSFASAVEFHKRKVKDPRVKKAVIETVKLKKEENA